MTEFLEAHSSGSFLSQSLGAFDQAEERMSHTTAKCFSMRNKSAWLSLRPRLYCLAPLHFMPLNGPVPAVCIDCPTVR